MEQNAAQAALPSDRIRDVDVNLGFSPECRAACEKLFVSAQGMVRSGFIGDGSRSDGQHVVAYIPLKDHDYDSYVASVRKHGHASAVREARKAAEAGFVCGKFPRYLHIPDIHEINTSTPIRSGQPMSATYGRSIEEMGGAPTRPVPLPTPTCLRHHQTYFGVFVPEDGYAQGAVTTNRRLVGYLSLNRYGDCAIYTLFLGHHDYLRSHVMKLLHLETMRAVLDPNDAAFDGLDYLMYHRYITANPGLTSWKKAMNFTPGYWINRGEPVL